jgi:transposase InsO family protein
VGQSHGRNALSQRDFEVDVGVFRSGARPPHDEVIAFIDNHRDHFAVEFICRTLRATIVGFLTFRGYRAAKARPRSARAIRDGLLIDELKTVHEQNFSVDGVEKMHVAMTRRSWRVGREQTRQLLRAAGLRGVQRGKPVFTTIADPAVALPADPVKRRFTAAAPNRLWVADVTFVRTWAGFCDTAFVTDACTRAVVGWSVAATMRIEDLPLQAFNQAQRGGLILRFPADRAYGGTHIRYPRDSPRQ